MLETTLKNVVATVSSCLTRSLLSFASLCIGCLLIAITGCGGSSGGGNTESRNGNKSFESQATLQVRLNQGRLAAILIRRKSDRRYIFRAFPRGLAFAAGAEPLKSMTFPQLRQLLKAEKGKIVKSGTATRSAGQAVAKSAPAAATPTATSTPYSNTGFPTGYSTSVGPTSGDCFNFTVGVPNAPTTVVDFASNSSATSFSSMLKTSDSVSTADDGFQASDDFSYTQNYQDTANSGQVTFSAYSVYDLQPVLNSTTPLNDFGTQASEVGTFSQLCGDNFIEQVAAGAVIMGQFTWSSTSSTASDDVSNTLKGGSTLFDISSAISSAQSVSNSITSFDFDLYMVGGGVTASDDMLTAYEGASASLSSCTAQPSNQTDCNTFVSDMNSGAATALTAFNDVAESSSGTLPQDLSIFQQLPNGLAGVDTASLEYFSLSSIVSGVSDAFEPYATQLNDYMGLINEIATLNNRVASIDQLAGGTTFDPTTFLSLEDNLSQLSTIYSTDLTTMLTNMSNCLTGTGAVASDCAAIIDNQLSGTVITNAYQWYTSGAPNPNQWSSSQLFQAQQNSIALQYNVVNIIQIPGKSEYQTPMQAMYINQLPTFSSPNTSLSGVAALISFADQEFYSYLSSGKAETYPFVVVTPIKDTGSALTGLSDFSSAANLSDLGLIIDGQMCSGGSNSCIPTLSFKVSCSPTITDPCPFEYGIDQNEGDIGDEQFFENYVPISNFFTENQ